MTEQAMRQAIGLQQAGRWQDAGRVYREVLRTNPRHFEALYSLGMVHLHLGELDAAQTFMGEALKVNPRFGEGWCSRGIVLMQMRRREEALTCFDSALTLLPYFADAHSSRATALLEMNRLEEALAAFDKALALNPNHAISWNNRGNTFVAMRRLEEAVESFDRALALKPDLQTAENNRSLALLELKRVSRIPAHAVRALFDDYASYYDQAMLGPLSYRAPAHLRVLFDRIQPGASAPKRILDFGCGTGLSGEAFKDLAEGARLVGIDLSSLMIEQARQRGIYSELITGDFESDAALENAAYDLVIAADAVIYHGNLVPALSAAARRLVPKGICLFTVEKMAGGNWEQTSANRFRHSEAYVRSAASEAGLDWVDLMEGELRTETMEPVAGLAVALKKPS